MKLCSVLMAVLVAACTSREAAVAQHPQAEQKEAGATGPGRAGSAQAEPAAPAEMVVEVVQGRITIDGVEVEPKAFALQTVLMNRSTLKTKLVVRSEATEADRAALLVAVREAVQTIAAKIELSLGELRLTLRSPFDDTWTNRRNWMVAAGPKEWTLSSASQQRLKFVAGDAESEARARAAVERECGSGECSADVTLSHDAPLVPTLLAWKRIYGDRDMTVLIDLPDPDGPRRPTTAATPKGGRLPPEVIQRLVRENFEKFRGCYERGLSKNANLTGKMRVRFVIGLDGKVSSAQDFGSNMPDLEVRQCVVEAFKTLTFPNPESGVVTVVYPIVLAPG